MQKNLTEKELKDLSENHTNNLEKLPFKTKGAVIDLDALTKFLNAEKQKHGNSFDGVRIYFVRYELDPPPIKRNNIEKANADTKFSQVSLVFAPVNIKGRTQWEVEDLKNQDQKFSTFCICHPEDNTAPDQTGVCPPKIGCPDPPGSE